MLPYRDWQNRSGMLTYARHAREADPKEDGQAGQRSSHGAVGGACPPGADRLNERYARLCVWLCKIVILFLMVNDFICSGGHNTQGATPMSFDPPATWATYIARLKLALPFCPGCAEHARLSLMHTIEQRIEAAMMEMIAANHPTAH